MACLLAVSICITGCNGTNDVAIDPCRVLAVEDVERLLFNEVAEGLETGVGQSCYFPSLRPDGRSLLMNIVPGDSPEKFRRSSEFVSNVEPLRPSVESEGLWEEAYSYSSSHSSNESATAGADARRGTTRLRVLVSGPRVEVSMAEATLTAVAEVIEASFRS